MTMLGSALIVASDRSDARFSLHPLALALTPICERVEHLLLVDAPAAHGRSCKAVDARAGRASGDGLLHMPVAVPPCPPGRRGNFGSWFAALERWANFPSAALERAAQDADLVIIQSGLAAALILRLRRRAPEARLAYFATEPMGAAHPQVAAVLARRLPLVDCAVAIRPALQRELARFVGPVPCFVPPLDPALIASPDPSPYPDGRHVAVIGGAALDGVTVAIAAAACPEVRFHVLGKVDGKLPSNVGFLDRVSTKRAATFLKHADAILVASGPADESPAGVLLAEQLALFAHWGLPTVHPSGIADAHPRSYGFDPGRSASLREAVAAALTPRPRPIRGPAPDWCDLAAEFAAGSPRTSATIRASRKAAHAG